MNDTRVFVVLLVERCPSQTLLESLFRKLNLKGQMYIIIINSSIINSLIIIMVSLPRTFADWCSDHIKERLKWDSGYVLLRSVSSLSQPERDTITVTSDDEHISAMWVSSDKLVHSDWHISDALTIRLKNIHYYKYNDNDYRYNIQHWIRWYPTGQLESESDFEGCNRMGYWRSWYPTGQLRAKGYYENGCLVGHWRFWYDTGQLESEGDYESHIRSECLPAPYKSEQPWESCDSENGLRVGHWRFWHDTGLLYDEGEYEHGRRIGCWRRQFKNETILIYNISLDGLIWDG